MTTRLWSHLPRVAVLVLALAAVVPVQAAEVVKPWVPSSDTLLSMAAFARSHFERQQGDSTTGDNYAAYLEVGEIGRWLLRSLGRNHTLQAPAIAATLDSVGLDVEVATDTHVPSIVFMLVRNPVRPKSDAVGFLYWYRLDDLRMQGVSFPPAVFPRLRTWWTGREDVPYEAGILYVLRAPGRNDGGFDLLRMDPDGYLWHLIQYEGHGPAVGPNDDADFADANHDGQPELLVFSPVNPDSYFVLLPGVPPIQDEILYVERPEGFVPFDARTVPGPLEALRAFAELLADHQIERAQRMLLDPKRVRDAVASGWLGLHRPGAWTVEYGEREAWPTWFEVRIQTVRGVHRWVFHFAVNDYSRWVIKDWLREPEKPSAHAEFGPPTAADSVRTRRP